MRHPHAVNTTGGGLGSRFEAQIWGWQHWGTFEIFTPPTYENPSNGSEVGWVVDEGSWTVALTKKHQAGKRPVACQISNSGTKIAILAKRVSKG